MLNAPSRRNKYEVWHKDFLKGYVHPLEDTDEQLPTLIGNQLIEAYNAYNNDLENLTNMKDEFSQDSTSPAKTLWAVGAMWTDENGSVDKTEEFIANDIWEIGWDDTNAQFKQLSKINLGDVLLLKSTSTKGKNHSISFMKIKNIGIVESTSDGGSKLRVKWQKNMLSYDVDGFSYRKTIEPVNNPKVIDAIIAATPDSLKHLLTGVKSAEGNQPTTSYNHPLNQILYGPPGTGKTYHTRALAVAIAEGKSVAEVEIRGRAQINSDYAELEKDGRIVFTTFHQSMGYEDFVEGIKPGVDDDDIGYKVQPGILKQLADKARAGQGTHTFDEAYAKLIEAVSENQDAVKLYTPIQNKPFLLKVKPNKNLHAQPQTGKDTEVTITKEKLKQLLLNGVEPLYYQPYYRSLVTYLKKTYNIEINKADTRPHILIIDEINRGNVSAIFGELITLIEDGKRAGEGQKETISVTLPYSGEKFTLPANLYIIGTMNTADRSVEALDTALRRRFAFVEMMPNAELLNELPIEGLEDIITTINQRLTYLKDKNHTLGHAFFMECASAVDVIQVIAHKILPLLEEFFYGETVKIGMVLSTKFLTDEIVKNGKGLFAGDRANLVEIDLDQPLPRRSKTGPELLDEVGSDENLALEYLQSILA